MILKIVKIIAIALSALLLILFGVAYDKVDKTSTSKLKDAWKGFLGLKTQASSRGVLGSKTVPNSITNTPKTPTTANTIIPVFLRNPPVISPPVPVPIEAPIGKDGPSHS